MMGYDFLPAVSEERPQICYDVMMGYHFSASASEERPQICYDVHLRRMR